MNEQGGEKSGEEDDQDKAGNKDEKVAFEDLPNRIKKRIEKRKRKKVE